MLAEIIKTHALADAQAGDWETVAATLQSITVTATPRLCYAVESGNAAVAAGGDHAMLLGALLQDPNGIMLFQKLSSSAGVMWAHEVTEPYLAWLVSQGKMSQAVHDALIDLSSPVTHPHADVTAEQCSEAWAADQLQIQRLALRLRLDTILNQIGTSEQADGIADLRAIANELEAV